MAQCLVVLLVLVLLPACSGRVDLPLLSVDGDPPVQRFAAVALRVRIGTAGSPGTAGRATPTPTLQLLYDTGSALSWTWSVNADCPKGAALALSWTGLCAPAG